MSERTALYRHWDQAGRLLYVGISLSAVTRLSQHYHASHWSDQIDKVTIQYFSTRHEALEAERVAIRVEKPTHNIIHNRPIAANDNSITRSFVKVSYPECNWSCMDHELSGMDYNNSVLKTIADNPGIKPPTLNALFSDVHIRTGYKASEIVRLLVSCGWVVRQKNGGLFDTSPSKEDPWRMAQYRHIAA